MPALIKFRQPQVSAGDDLLHLDFSGKSGDISCVTYCFSDTFGSKAVLFIKETVELESRRNWRSLLLLTMLMVSEVHIVMVTHFWLWQFLVHGN